MLFRYKSCNIMCQVAIRDKENIFIRKVLYDLYCICRSNAYIRMTFQFCSWINITDYRKIIILRTHFLDRFRGCHMCHRAICCHIWHQNRLFRVQDLGTLTHKGNSAKYNRLFFQAYCHLAQIKGISYVIRYLLDLRSYIIMSQDHRIFFFL